MKRAIRPESPPAPMPGLLLLLAAVFTIGCAHVDPAESAYFARIGQTLREAGVGRPVIVVDLDRLDHNIDVARAHFTDSHRLRVTEKSLPSIGLLQYVIDRIGSHRVMAFHHPFLPELLAALPPDTDILFGKTIPIAGVAEVWARLDEAQRADAARRVQWLVDCPRTLAELVAFFRARNTPFSVNVEIDVGLHRGGAMDEAELDAILDAIRANAPLVTFTGLMGYDGHLPHAPTIGTKLGTMRRGVRAIERTYAGFVDHIRIKFPALFQTARTFNGGGSKTYSLYAPDSVVNDIAMGSGLLKPRDFDLPTLDEHRPAVFIATPILKRLHPARIPFLGRVSLRRAVDGYFIYGGGWSPEIEFPRGIHGHFLMDGPPNGNLVSNQSFLYGEADPPVEPGDFVFLRPEQSDAIFLFDEIRLVRGGKLVGSWRPFASRY